MTRVLHFAGIINRDDFIDTVLIHLDRSRFEISALTAIPSRRADPHTSSEAYATRCLNVPLTRAHYPKLLAALIQEIRRFRPHIVHAHHYDEGLLASIAVRLLGCPALVLGHHYSDHIYFLSRGWRRRVHLAIEAFTNRAAARIVVPAQEVFALLVDRQGEPASKVEVIPYALPIERYRPSSPDAPGRIRAAHGLEGAFVVLACCRLNKEKGLDHLLRAMPALKAAHQDLRLVLAGDGSYRADLVELSRTLGVDDRVTFIGWRDDSLDWIAAADVVVQPSLCESYCQVLIEALAMRTPVVMTPVGAAPEVIGDNQRGRLVAKGDAGAIRAAVDELARDRALGPRLGEAGHAFLREYMRIDAIVRRHEALYQRVAEDAVRGRAVPVHERRNA